MKQSFVFDFVKPIVVLLCICLFVSGALAVVNGITEPVIKNAGIVRAAAAKKVIMPQVDEFEMLDIESFRSQGMPATVTEIHRAANDTGYIFAVTVIGYGGEIKLLCGVDIEGRIIRAATLAQTETKGLGTPIFEEHHAGQYWGKNKSGIEDIEVISGATITSNAFKNGMRYALTAFDIVTSQRGGAYRAGEAR